MSKFTDAMTKILDIVVKEQQFLTQNPKQLAILMDEFQTIHIASRYHPNEELQDWDNPKDQVMDLEDTVEESYAFLVYDAWFASVDRREISNHPIDRKSNKTVDDIVKMCLDKDYRYNSIFPDRKSVLDHYFCRCGTGLEWTEGGYLGRIGPSGVDMSLFAYYWEEKVSPKLKIKMTWMKDSDIKLAKELKAASDKEHAEKDAELQEILKKSKIKLAKSFENQPFSEIIPEYSPICNIPHNAESSYVKAAIEICDLILNGEKELIANKKIAKNLLPELKIR